MKKVLAAVIVLAGFATTSNAQTVSATATASATIVAPITLTKSVDLVFGNVSVGAASGTVQLSAAASPTRTPGGGVLLAPGNAGSPTAAKFAVTGTTGYNYVITLPTSASLTGPGTAMTASTFTTNIAGGIGSITGTAASDVFYVGATLAVNASQAVGSYTSTGFTVTVNYQ